LENQVVFIEPSQLWRFFFCSIWKIKGRKIYGKTNEDPVLTTRRCAYPGVSRHDLTLRYKIQHRSHAKAEGVRESTIWESIERGLRNIEKLLKNLVRFKAFKSAAESSNSLLNLNTVIKNMFYNT
jgi:hypothetical protein